jgi:hypothetical protein
MSASFVIKNHGVLQIEDDRAFFTTCNGTAYAYAYNQLAPGHKPVAWSLFNDAAYAAHCSAHGCCPSGSYMQHIGTPWFNGNGGMELFFLVHEVVQAGGGGYRPVVRPKTAEFRPQ